MKKSTLFWRALFFINTAISLVILIVWPWQDTVASIWSKEWMLFTYSMLSVYIAISRLIFTALVYIDIWIDKFNNYLDK